MAVPILDNEPAVHWADVIRTQMTLAASYNDPQHAEIDEVIMEAPRRRAADPAAASLAADIARLLYPSFSDSVQYLIHYERDIVALRHMVVDQRKQKIIEGARRNEDSDWGKRILKQGAWDHVADPWSLDGAPSLPMPVVVAEPQTLAPFFHHLALDGTEDKSSSASASVNATVVEEPYYNVQSLEFEKGVLYSDHRLDLCKMVVGPRNIGDLMESLRPNRFVKHFLLGNNIIGPHGAKCIASFLREIPNRIDTWYLAGNCIDTASLTILVDEWIKSTSVTNIWLKRNPLKTASADDLFRLIAYTPNLRTLDLDQTELGNGGVTSLFTQLACHTPEKPLPLRNIYLNAVGIGAGGAKAIAAFLSSPHCQLEGLYASNNPLGNDGVIALAQGLKNNKSLARLSLKSVGVSDAGAIALFQALSSHPSIATLDIGQSFATPDLATRYNWITDASSPALCTLIASCPSLAYLNLGQCALTNACLNELLGAVIDSHSLLYYFAKTIHPQERHPEAIFAGQEHVRLAKQAHARLVENVERVYGVGYHQFHTEHKRWLVSDKTDVRKIDSVYRNRDAGDARRGLKVLDKWWGEEDETLKEVMKGVVG